jgi:S-DNA-T family DNA segregation ATPase FtsK/SpoIIIE
MQWLKDIISKLTIPKAGDWNLPTREMLGARLGDLAKSAVPSRSMVEVQEAIQYFDVDAQVFTQTRLPSSSRYQVVLGAGVRFASLKQLETDLAIALGVNGVRVDTGLNGSLSIEITEDDRQAVELSVDNVEFRRFDRELPVDVGEGPHGRVIMDLAALPHLLVAGTTGSGKSVFLNELLAGLHYARSPDQVEFFLIDPKVVEFSQWAGSPFVSEVVTDTVRARTLLYTATRFMDERYMRLAKAGVRQISEYNQLHWPRQYLRRQVIIVDEVADLFGQSKQAMEHAIRLAQKGRAAGIHLVLATQKPLVSIIGSTLKANMPSRLAFKVQNSMDSRVILDEVGAEGLRGKGDGLYLSPEGSLSRIQSPFVGDEEIKNLIQYWRQQ